MKQTAVILLVCFCLVLSACAVSTGTVHITTEPAPSALPAQIPESTSIATIPPKETEDETKTPVVGTVVVREADTLENDTIPQLCSLFSLSEEEVKDVLANAQSDLIQDELEGFRRMEGIIIPGSYDITDETLDDCVNIWIDLAEQRYADLLSATHSPNELPAHEQLTLASIVEWECIGDAFEPQAATVFLNRLDEGDKLRSCVTVEYALGYQRPYLTSEDLKMQSDYNTYQVRGLPPGPICAMDDESLAAAIGNSIDENLYFFFYDYAQSTMYFFNDYDAFKQAGKESSARFEDTFDFDKYDIVVKREVFNKN